MVTLYLLRYNNYYNRRVKKEESLSDYTEYLVKDKDGNSEKAVIQNVNFIENDFINTIQVVNWEGTLPDYLLVVDADQNIKSRWFVVNTVKTRLGQLQISLHRDLMVDYYSSVVNAPCFIERATPLNINDPAIYNKENTCNQIKQSETLLRDKTGCAWVVGYIPRGYSFGDEPIEAEINYDGMESESLANIENYSYYPFTTSPYLGDGTTKKYTVVLGVKEKLGPYYMVTEKFAVSPTAIEHIETTKETISVGIYNSISLQISGVDNVNNIDFTAIDNGYASVVSSLFSQFNSVLGDGVNRVHSAAETNAFLNEQGKIILDTTSKTYYKIAIADSGEWEKSEVVQNSQSGLFRTLANNLVRQLPLMTTTTLTVSIGGNPNTGSFVVNGVGREYTVSLEPGAESVKLTIPDNRPHVPEQNFDMFCIPFLPDSETHLTVDKDNEVYLQDPNALVALNVATQIVSKTGQDTVYDVQLLPYCPATYCIKDEGRIELTDTASDIVNSSGEVVNVLLWANSSKFEVRMPVTISGGLTIKARKIITETQMYRLCSPNYSSMFEFNPALNYGVSEIIANCTYQPFNPYIRLALDFKGLYGYEAGDARGLICGGDFSLPQATSAWANYQLQNKNYQALFDRQIQNMETKNDVARTQEKWTTAAGVLGAAVGGAGAGLMTGKPLGALAGLVTGGLSLAGGLTDIELNEKLRKEGKDFAQDAFDMHNENIKALPQGLSKTNPFTANNKIFPFIEKYDCTSEEKEAISLQIQYRGMEINRISKPSVFISAFTRTYIKARIILVDNLKEDYHIASAIAEELYKGVFI